MEKWLILRLGQGIHKMNLGNSLAVQWLGLSVFAAGARVQSLVRELRSCKPCGMAGEEKKKV